MITIQVLGIAAVWNDDEGRWDSANVEIAELLNGSIPDAINDYEAPLRTGGRQGIALRGARKLFKSDLKVTKRTPPPAPPDEEPGVDYSVAESEKGNSSVATT